MGVTSGLPALERATSIPRSDLRVPGYWRCGAVLSLVWLGLRVVGFGRTLTTVRSIAARRQTVPTGMVDVCRIAGRVAAVAAFFPGRVLCLEQSLALYWLLRLQGVAATLRFGVHPAPFTAHAWIEYEGVPVNEDDDRIRELLPLPIEGTEGM